MRIFKWAAFIWVVSLAASMAQTVEHGIVVTGEGRIATEPDMATISLGATQTATSAKEAMAEVSQKVAAILAQLDQMGVAPKDRQTRGFYLHPVYNTAKSSVSGTSPTIVGYTAGNSVMVRVRDLAGLGDMLDGVIALGANDFNGLSFGLQDTSDVMAQARAKAVEDAVLRATQLAQAAGLKLGAILRMTESSHGGRPMMMEMASARSRGGESIAAGEVEVSAQVTLVFAIAPAL